MPDSPKRALYWITPDEDYAFPSDGNCTIEHNAAQWVWATIERVKDEEAIPDTEIIPKEVREAREPSNL